MQLARSSVTSVSDLPPFVLMAERVSQVRTASRRQQPPGSTITSKGGRYVCARCGGGRCRPGEDVCNCRPIAPEVSIRLGQLTGARDVRKRPSGDEARRSRRRREAHPLGDGCFPRCLGPSPRRTPPRQKNPCAPRKIRTCDLRLRRPPSRTGLHRRPDQKPQRTRGSGRHLHRSDPHRGENSAAFCNG